LRETLMDSAAISLIAVCLLDEAKPQSTTPGADINNVSWRNAEGQTYEEWRYSTWQKTHPRKDNE
jgi:hypothetical protein